MKAFLMSSCFKTAYSNFHLCILLVEFLTNRRIAYRCTASNQRLQFGDQNSLADGIFEGGRGEVVLLQQTLVFRLTYKGSAGKENFRILAMLPNSSLDFLRGGFQPQVLGLGDQCLPVDQLVGGALRKKGSRMEAIRAQLPALLLQHPTRRFPHFVGGNILGRSTLATTPLPAYPSSHFPDCRG